MNNLDEKIGVLILDKNTLSDFEVINNIPLFCYRVCDLIKIGCNHIYIAYYEELNSTYNLEENDDYKMLLNVNYEAENFKVELLPINFNYHEDKENSETKFFIKLFGINNGEYTGKNVLFYTPKYNSLLIGDISRLSIKDWITDIGFVKRRDHVLFSNIRFNKDFIYKTGVGRIDEFNSIAKIAKNCEKFGKNYPGSVGVTDISNTIGLADLPIGGPNSKNYTEDEIKKFESNYFSVFGNVEFEAYRAGFLTRGELHTRYNRWCKSKFYDKNKVAVISYFLLSGE